MSINEWDRGQIFEITSCIGSDDPAFFFVWTSVMMR